MGVEEVRWIGMDRIDLAVEERQMADAFVYGNEPSGF